MRTLTQFFQLLHERFPLSTMRKEFRGSHSLTYQGDHIELLLWENGSAYRIGLEENDFDDLPNLMWEIRMHVDEMKKKFAPKKIQKEC